MRLAIIPARGGSKRIPRKNIKLFDGKPMIAWSIESAKESGCFDRILVSTDDEEIATVATKYGAEVPFKRPTELSGDHISTIPVIAHAINWHNSNNADEATVCCCIYATAPLLCPEDLKLGLALLHESGADFAFGVTGYSFPIQRAIRITSGGRVAMIQPENYETRSQDLDETWHDAGQFYWGKATAWTQGQTVFSENAVPVILPRSRVQDIDTEQDWEYAEIMKRVINRRNIE